MYFAFHHAQRSTLVIRSGKLRRKVRILIARITPFLGIEEQRSMRDLLLHRDGRNLLANAAAAQKIQFLAGLASLLAGGVERINCLIISGGIELVPPCSPGALAACLRGILGDERRRASLGAEARANVENEFSWRRCGERTVAAYAEAMR